jgi:hypothetical protein
MAAVLLVRVVELLQIRVFECFRGADAGVGIINQHLAQEIERECVACII